MRGLPAPWIRSGAACSRCWSASAASCIVDAPTQLAAQLAALFARELDGGGAVVVDADSGGLPAARRRGVAATSGWRDGTETQSRGTRRTRTSHRGSSPWRRSKPSGRGAPRRRAAALDRARLDAAHRRAHELRDDELLAPRAAGPTGCASARTRRPAAARRPRRSAHVPALSPPGGLAGWPRRVARLRRPPPSRRSAPPPTPAVHRGWFVAARAAHATSARLAHACASCDGRHCK